MEDSPGDDPPEAAIPPRPKPKAKARAGRGVLKESVGKVDAQEVAETARRPGAGERRHEIAMKKLDHECRLEQSRTRHQHIKELLALAALIGVGLGCLLIAMGWPFKQSDGSKDKAIALLGAIVSGAGMFFAGKKVRD